MSKEDKGVKEKKSKESGKLNYQEYLKSKEKFGINSFPPFLF
jgi:hypothetical protein